MTTKDLRIMETGCFNQVFSRVCKIGDFTIIQNLWFQTWRWDMDIQTVITVLILDKNKK